jgi:hypothetical protein
MALRSHLLAAAVFGPYAIDERAYAASLWETIPDHSLVLVDRHYLQANVLVPLTTKRTERHWITRAKSKVKSLFLCECLTREHRVQVGHAAAA